MYNYDLSERKPSTDLRSTGGLPSFSSALCWHDGLLLVEVEDLFLDGCPDLFRENVDLPHFEHLARQRDQPSQHDGGEQHACRFYGPYDTTDQL